MLAVDKRKLDELFASATDPKEASLLFEANDNDLVGNNAGNHHNHNHILELAMAPALKQIKQ